MNLSTIQVLARSADLGLKLGIEPPATLTLQPVDRCPPDFAPALKAHKPALLALLQLPFVMVESQILRETIFFCEDEDTKLALIQAGAVCWSIYTKDELRVLVAQNRVVPLSADELRKVHEIKRAFHGRIAK